MINCVNCGKETSNPKFCSRSCGISHNNKLNPKRKKGVVSPNDNNGCLPRVPAKPIDCKTCQKTFIPSSSKKTYCSLECHNNYYANYIEKTGTFLQPGCSGGGCNKAIRKYMVNKHGNQCMVCGLDANNWNGKSMTLIVDHINGDAYDCSVANIRLVCPNCDSQLPTYKGRNKGKSTRRYFITQK